MGQASWVEPENPDVTQPVRLYVDLSKTTNTSCADLTGPFYIWTWKPFEHPAGSGKENGTGDKPWKNSNDILVMKQDLDKGAKVWYYEMTPTEFYGVAASEVYSKGISFLVKPKDGGGYGDPDLKTEDLNIVIAPPKLTRSYIYQVPAVILSNEITNIFYDNPVDTNVGMKNLAEGDAYLWIKCSGTDTITGAPVVYQPSSFFNAGSNPSLEMKKDLATGRFYLTMIPQSFFGFSPTFKPKEIECTVRRKVYTSTADRTTDQPKIKVGCD
ncbi:MAG: hypothetical protein CFE21_12100 [Bacteroidetes bacterium B1(2017)]|nr:MAG: hypothetical protein CFE21_12100 [Bacteroidetes bacterium B1(2017)]